MDLNAILEDYVRLLRQENQQLRAILSQFQQQQQAQKEEVKKEEPIQQSEK